MRTLITLCSLTFSLLTFATTPPQAKRVDQVDRYHSVEVADPYRWLEDMQSKETLAFTAAQAAHLDAFLKPHQQTENALFERLKSLLDFDRYSLPQQRGQNLFYLRTPAGGGDPELMHKIGDQTANALLTPENYKRFDDDRISRFHVSPSGRYLLYKVSRGQSTWGEMHLLDVTRNTYLDLAIARHRGIGGIAWRSDESGFFYTRFNTPKPGTELAAEVAYSRVMDYQIATGEHRLVLHKPAEPKAIFSPMVSDDGKWLLVSENLGSHPHNQIWAAPMTDRDWQWCSLLNADGNHTFLGNDGTRFRFQTTRDAPRGRIVSLDVNKPQQLEEIVPQSGAALVTVREAGDHLLVLASQDADIRVLIYDTNGKHKRDVQLPFPGWPWQVGGSNPDSNQLFYTINGLFNPGSVYNIDLETGNSKPVLTPDLAIDTHNYSMRQVFFESRDGTRVPMFIAHRKDVTPNPQTPVFMYGYGAYGWSAYPWYQPYILTWLDMGGIYVLPGIRGGGEYGASWHEAGIRKHKQNGIDDYLAAARYLIAQGWTSEGKIVANGGSASGVVAAAAMMQAPNLFGAALINIPTLDLLRFDQFGTGKYRVSEYGSPQDAEEFSVLRKLSPVHNVAAKTCYPATMITVGEKDEVAVPAHGYKFIAALQHHNNCDQPALLKVVTGAGHSVGTTPEQAARTRAQQLTFLAKVMGMQVPQTMQTMQP